MEKPTIETEQPATSPKDSAPASPNPHADLLAELERFGVKDAGELQGKLAAAQQVGNMGNVLGEVRRENEELKKFIREQMQQQKSTPVLKRDEWGSPSPEAGTIDLKDLIKDTVRSEFRGAIQEEKQQAMRQQQEAIKAYQKITSDPDFHIVKDVWEAKLKDPNFALQIQSGQVDPIAEYQEMLRGAYKSAIRKSADIIKNLTTTPTAPQLHVEGQARIPGQPVREVSDKEKTLNPLREKLNKGKPLTEEEELTALMKVLGSGSR